MNPIISEKLLKNIKIILFSIYNSLLNYIINVVLKIKWKN